MRVGHLRCANLTEASPTGKVCSVVICCGGTGYILGNYFKKYILENMDLLLERNRGEEILNRQVAFLHVDPDYAPTLPLADAAIEESERVRFHSNIKAVVSDPGRFPGVGEWFPMDPKILEKIGTMVSRLEPEAPGMGTTRPFGRCGIMTSPDLLHRIEHTVRRIQKGPRDNLNFFLLSSLGGGTGTGIFLDIAAILRALKKNTFPNDAHWRIWGIFAGPRVVLSEPNISPMRSSVIRANSYAAIKELYHFLEGHPFEAKYSFLRDRVELQNRGSAEEFLFDLALIVDQNTLENGQLAGKVALGKMVGQFLFHLHFGVIWQELLGRSVDSKVSESVLDQEVDTYKTCFGSLGCVTISLPICEIMEYCRHRAAFDVVSELHGSVEPEEPGNKTSIGETPATEVLHRAQDLPEKLGIYPDKVVKSLIESLKPVTKNLTPGNDLRERARELKDDQNVTKRKEKFLADGGLFSNWGIIPVTKGKIYRELEGLLCTENKAKFPDLEGAKQVVLSFRGLLDSWRKDLLDVKNDEVERLYQRNAAAYLAVERELKDLEAERFLRRVLNFFRRRGLARELQECAQTVNGYLTRYLANLLCADFYGEIDQEIQRIADAEFETLAGLLINARINLEKTIGAIVEDLVSRAESDYSVLLVKCSRQDLEFFYNQKFKPLADIPHLCEKLREEGIVKQGKRIAFQDFSDKSCGIDSRDIVEKVLVMVDEQIKVEEVYGGKALPGVKALWETTFEDVRGEKNPAGIFEWRQGGSPDDFDYMDQELRKRGSPALKYDRSGLSPAQFEYSFGRILAGASHADWWCQKLLALNPNTFKPGIFPTKLTLVSLHLGIPPQRVEGLRDWKEQYELRKQDGYPLHIFKDAETWKDLV